MSKHEITAQKLIKSFEPLCIEKHQYDVDYFNESKAIKMAIILQKRVIKVLKFHGLIDEFQNAIYNFLVIQDKK